MSIVAAVRSSQRWRMYAIAALILIVIACLGPLTANADGPVVTAEEAQRAALAWLNTAPAFASADQSGGYLPAGPMLEVKDQAYQETIAYVQELLPVGFIIVTPSFDLKPVIAYSTDSAFSAAEVQQNVLLDMLRTDIPTRLKATEVNGINSGGETVAHRQWRMALEMVDEQGNVQIIDGMARIQYDVDLGPYVTSEWNQSNDRWGKATWNYYTPPNANGSTANYPCGCVATAYGQILNYNQWPMTGTGSHGYTESSRPHFVDFGATEYFTASHSVLDVYLVDSTLKQRQAVGRVVHDAGVAVEMQYGAGGSGAYTWDVADALKDHFRSAGEWVLNTDSSFYDALYANMLNERPGVLSIKTATSGHAVVIDGVQHDTPGTRYYHLNMGWGGSSDAYYDITPPFSAGGHTWTSVYGAVLDIVPTPDLAELGTTCSDSCFGVSWDVSRYQNASKYELQQMLFANAPVTIGDGAEGGAGDWIIFGGWEASGEAAHNGSQSFRGYFTFGVPYGTIQLDKNLMVGPNTSISYYWRSELFYPAANMAEARLEISSDGNSWTVLTTHDTQSQLAWQQEMVSSAALSAFEGRAVSLRFAVERTSGGSIYDGVANSWVGFFFDDLVVNDIRYSDGWTTLDDSIMGQSKTIHVAENGDYRFRARAHACDPSAEVCTAQSFEWSEIEEISVTGLHKSTGAGAWSSGGTWDAGSAPGASNSAIIQANHTVTVDGDATCHDLTNNVSAVVAVPDASSLTVADDLVNNGTLRQTQVVNGSSDVGFFNTGGYGGVILNAENVDLGSTVVTIKGNQDCAAGSNIQRCLSITPASSQTPFNTTVTFFFSPKESEGVACESVELYHFTNGAWAKAGDVAQRKCDGDLYYVKVTGVDGFSDFVVGDGPPPTSVGLARFEAWPAEGDRAVQLEWETGSEISLLGFNLYRKVVEENGQVDPETAATQLNEGLIQGEFSGSPQGGVYPWLDDTVTPGVTYRYWLETVDMQSEATAHEPVTVTVPALSRWGVYLPMVTK